MRTKRPNNGGSAAEGQRDRLVAQSDQLSQAEALLMTPNAMSPMSHLRLSEYDEDLNLSVITPKHR